jgi:hypothetical protein
MHFAGYWRITTVIEFWLSCLLNRYAGFTTGRREMVFSSRRIFAMTVPYRSRQNPRRRLAPAWTHAWID